MADVTNLRATWNVPGINYRTSATGARPRRSVAVAARRAVRDFGVALRLLAGGSCDG